SLYDCTACHHELRSRLGMKDRPVRFHLPGRPPLATWPWELARLGARQNGRLEERSNLLQQLNELDKAITGKPFGSPAAIKAAATTLAPSLQQLVEQLAQQQFDDAKTRQAIMFLTDATQLETNDFYTARQTAWVLRELAVDLGQANVPILFFRDSDD